MINICETCGLVLDDDDSTLWATYEEDLIHWSHRIDSYLCGPVTMADECDKA